jgi:hypothetical protein
MNNYAKMLYRSIFVDGDVPNPFEDTTNIDTIDIDTTEILPSELSREERIQKFQKMREPTKQIMVDPVLKELEFEEKQRLAQQKLAISPYAVRTVGRLGLPEEAVGAFTRFADLVSDVESDGRTNAKNKITSASGAFQFVKGSVLPALNRMARFGDLPDWASELKEAYEKGVDTKQHQKLITNLNYEQQRDMFLADITEKTVKEKGYGDSLLKKIAEGSVDAMKELYYLGHHTNPDDATRKRVDKIFK